MPAEENVTRNDAVELVLCMRSCGSFFCVEADGQNEIRTGDARRPAGYAGGVGC